MRVRLKLESEENFVKVAGITGAGGRGRGEEEREGVCWTVPF